jgi:hypothetical protein
MYFSASIFFKISTTLVYLYSNSANAFHVQYLNGYYVRLFDGPPASQHIHDLYLKLCEDIENFTRKNGASVATVIIQDLDYIIRKIDTTSVWSPGFDDELQKSNVRTAEKLEWDDEIKSRKIPNPDYQIKRLAVYGVKDISTPATLLDVFIYRLRRAKVILASLQNHSKSKIGSNTDSTTQVYTNLRENHKAIQILFRALTMSRTRRIYELYRNEFQKIVSEINNGNPDGIILPWLKAEQIWKERGTLDQDRLYLQHRTNFIANRYISMSVIQNPNHACIMISWMIFEN